LIRIKKPGIWEKPGFWAIIEMYRASARVAAQWLQTAAQWLQTTAQWLQGAAQ